MTLLWMVSRLFRTIRTALYRVFNAQGRHMVLGKLFDFLLAILVAVEVEAGRVIAGTPLFGPAPGGFLGRVLSFTFAFLVFFLL